jgi:VWFA-related protein
MVRAGGVAVVLAGWLAAGAASSAQQTADRAEVTATRVEGGQLTAAVAVLDAASNPVTGLALEAFTATIDGVAVSPSGVTSGLDAALPLGIILTVDTSGSMQGAALASAKDAILPLVNAMQGNDQAALLTFAQTVVVPVPLTGETGTLAAAIQAMNATGNTALFAGVTRAAEIAGAAPQPRRAVVLLSDGEDFGAASGGITREQALETARSTGVPFFVVGLGQEVDQQFLTTLATSTGGQYFAAADPAQLSQLYVRISDRLRQQYTLSLELPEDLPGGSHRLTVSAGGATGVATFETEGPPPAVAVLSPLPTPLSEEQVVSVSGLPAGSMVRFAIDGEPIESLSDGRSVRLDPYLFEPGREYILTAETGDGETLSQPFTAAPLPPLLVAPREVPDLEPGDLLRLTIRAQPGETTATFFVDGEQVSEVSQEPFDFVLPARDYEAGAHAVRVLVANTAGSVEATYPFAGPAAPGTNYAAYILLVAVVVVVLGGALYGGRRALGWYRARPEAVDVSGVGDQLAAWAELRRGGRSEAPVEGEAERPAGPWGRLIVVSGPEAGKVFELREDVELVGRAKFCSVQVTGPGVEDAHFVISRDGRLNASTPACRVEVDGVVVHSTMVTSGARLRAGETDLTFEGLS